MRVGIVFPGQSSQYRGMGIRLYENFDYVRELFKQADEVLEKNMYEVITQKPDLLRTTEYAQQAVYVVYNALQQVLNREYGIYPQFAAGHSLGEIMALQYAGTFSYEDALSLVKKRSEIMGNICGRKLGTMLSIISEHTDEIETIVENERKSGEKVWISAYNSANQTVISGSFDSIEKLERKLKESGRVIKLKVDGPFHSPFMQEATDELKEAVLAVPRKPFEIQVISSVTGKPYAGMEMIPDILAAQLVCPVRWTEVIQYMEERCVEVLIEAGPGSVLSNMGKKNLNFKEVFSMDREGSEETLKKLSQRVHEESKEKQMFYETVLTRCIKAAVTSKAYYEEKKEYAECKELFEQLNERYKKSDKISNTMKECLEAEEITRNILKKKHVAEERIYAVMQDIHGLINLQQRTK